MSTLTTLRLASCLARSVELPETFMVVAILGRDKNRARRWSKSKVRILGTVRHKQQAMGISRQQARGLPQCKNKELYSNTISEFRNPGSQLIRSHMVMDAASKQRLGEVDTPGPSAFARVMKLFEQPEPNKKPPQKPRSGVVSTG